MIKIQQGGGYCPQGGGDGIMSGVCTSVSCRVMVVKLQCSDDGDGHGHGGVVMVNIVNLGQ